MTEGRKFDSNWTYSKWREWYGSFRKEFFDPYSWNMSKCAVEMIIVKRKTSKATWSLPNTWTEEGDIQICKHQMH